MSGGDGKDIVQALSEHVVSTTQHDGQRASTLGEEQFPRQNREPRRQTLHDSSLQAGAEMLARGLHVSWGDTPWADFRPCS